MSWNDALPQDFINELRSRAERRRETSEQLDADYTREGRHQDAGYWFGVAKRQIRILDALKMLEHEYAIEERHSERERRGRAMSREVEFTVPARRSDAKLEDHWAAARQKIEDWRAREGWPMGRMRVIFERPQANEARRVAEERAKNDEVFRAEVCRRVQERWDEYLTRLGSYRSLINHLVMEPKNLRLRSLITDEWDGVLAAWRRWEAASLLTDIQDGG